MEQLREQLKDTATYQFLKLVAKEFEVFFTTLGEIVIQGLSTLKYIFTGQINWKDVIEQSSRFGVSSLPITISIVRGIF